MDTLPIVEEFDVLEDGTARLSTIAKVAMVYQLILQIAEETLCHGIVVGIKTKVPESKYFSPTAMTSPHRKPNKNTARICAVFLFSLLCGASSLATTFTLTAPVIKNKMYRSQNIYHHRRTMRRIIPLAMLVMTTLVQPAKADETIAIASNIPYLDDTVGNDAIRAECTWTGSISSYVTRATRGSVVAVNNLKTVAGKKLVVTITSVHAAGGGGFSGPKWGSVKGDLIDQGKILGSFEFSRSTMTGKMTACGTLENIAKALGKDIARWLKQRTTDAGGAQPEKDEPEEVSTSKG